jgi:type I restriction enzyme, S subunit
MRDWKEAPLEHFLTRLTYGFTNPMPTTESGPYMVTARDINGGRILYEQARSTSEEAFRNDITDKSRPDIGDVLVTKDGTLGRIAIVDRENVCINQSVALLKPADNLRPRFLKYLLEEPNNFERMLNDADGTTIKHIYITRLAKMVVFVPPLKIQDEIIGVLGAIDDKIDLNRRMNLALEAMARTIFKDWFIDFGPTRAKMECRAPYLAQKIWSLFPDRLDDEGKPEGWLRREIGSLGRVVTGKTPTTTEYDNFNGGYPFITIPDLDGRIYFEGAERTLSEKGAAAIKGSLLPARSVMMSCIATVGRCGITTKPSFTNQQINSVVCSEDIEPEYLYLVFRNLSNEIEQAGGGGSVYTNVSKSRFSAIDILVPPKEIQKEFVGPWFRRHGHNVSENASLSALRDLLLPKLMSGEIRVKDADKIAESAL